MADALYQTLVLAHAREPRNRGALPGHTHAAEGSNPLCGDRLRCEMTLQGQRIAALRFDGEACAIATATASLLSEALPEADAAALEQLRARFAAMLVEAREAPVDAALGELAALSELRAYPARHKCAMLAFATVRAAFEHTPLASTEGGATYAVTGTALS